MVAAPVAAGWMGDYLPLYLGNSWTYENLDPPYDELTDSVFEVIDYDGHPACRYGTGPADHNILFNNGKVITLYAFVDGGVLFDSDPDIVLAGFDDGTPFVICSESPCDTNLIRDWDGLDPTLRGLWGIDPVWDDLIVIASYDRDYNKNLQNMIFESNLPAGVEVPAGAVTGLEFYQREVGQVAEMDIDAESGGRVEYWVLVDHVVGVDDAPAGPLLRVEQNFPNPFNPSTTISFHLARPAIVTLRVFDLSGRLVRTLLDAETVERGRRDVRWNGRDTSGRVVPSGTYCYRLETGTFSATKRMILLK